MLVLCISLPTNNRESFSFFLSLRHVTKKAASEVSTILESRIAGTSVAGNVEETGRVLSRVICPCALDSFFSLQFLSGVGDGIGRVWGLKNVQGQLFFH